MSIDKNKQKSNVNQFIFFFYKTLQNVNKFLYFYWYDTQYFTQLALNNVSQ